MSPPPLSAEAIAHRDTCDLNHCADCGECQEPLERLYIIAADYGGGAFISILCATCDHRRRYRQELLKRREAARALLASPAAPSAPATPLQLAPQG